MVTRDELINELHFLENELSRQSQRITAIKKKVETLIPEPQPEQETKPVFWLTSQVRGHDQVQIGVFDHYTTVMNAVEDKNIPWIYLGTESGMWTGEVDGVVWTISEWVLNYASAAALNSSEYQRNLTR